MYYTSYTKEQYRSKLMRVPHGVIFGICEGLARRLDIPVSIVRIITIILFVSTGFFPTGLVYCLLALLLPVGPSI
ncbi:MAG: PspC domain-containing protein [Spirochaetales bacterium]|nr:PspC domain-containing protein [Spirochaetales bacterium]